MSSPLENGRLIFTATTINTLTYGIYLALSLMGIQLLLQRRLQQKISLIYSLVMLAITTIWFVVNTRTNEIELVEETYHQQWRFSLYCSSTNVAAVALNSIQFMGSDLLLLYRAYILWERSFLAIILPFLTWLAYIAVAIACNLSCTSISPSPAAFQKLATSYYALSVTTNALCTVLIVGKIVWHQRKIRELGIESDADYRFMSSVMSESGFFYAVSGIVHVVLMAKKDPLSTVSGAIFGAMAYITQAQIILRVALGVELQTTSAASARGVDAHGRKLSTAIGFASAFGHSTHATGETRRERKRGDRRRAE